MIAGLIMGLLAFASVGLIKLAHGNDAKIKIPQVFLLITLLGFWSMSLFFLILDMASKDYWICIVIATTIPIGIILWIMLSRRHRKANVHIENHFDSSAEKSIALVKESTNESQTIQESITNEPTIEVDDNTTIDDCDDIKEAVDSNVENDNQIKTCYNCGKETSGNGSFCRFCGKSLEQQTKYCRKCGAKLLTDSAYCEYCGTKIGAIKLLRRK